MRITKIKLSQKPQGAHTYERFQSKLQSIAFIKKKKSPAEELNLLLNIFIRKETPENC